MTNKIYNIDNYEILICNINNKIYIECKKLEYIYKIKFNYINNLELSINNIYNLICNTFEKRKNYNYKINIHKNIMNINFNITLDNNINFIFDINCKLIKYNVKPLELLDIIIN